MLRISSSISQRACRSMMRTCAAPTRNRHVLQASSGHLRSHAHTWGSANREERGERRRPGVDEQFVLCGRARCLGSKAAGGPETEEGKPPATEEGASGRSSMAQTFKKWGLREFSMFASFICMIDCTVFPVLLTVLPAAEILSPDNLHAIHELSEKVALYVVMPIGTTTTITNYILTRNKPLAALSTLGLGLILGSNYHVDWLPSFFYDSRIPNTLGCAALLISGYLTHKLDPHHDHHHRVEGKANTHSERVAGRHCHAALQGEEKDGGKGTR